MPDYVDERFGWDVAKSEDCYRRRHFDFKHASRVFESDDYYEELDERESDGEERNVCVGKIDGLFFTVSAWVADDGEVTRYVKYFGYT